jgi:hypothetical protein
MKLRHLIAVVVVGLGVSSGPAIEIVLPSETARLMESPLPGYTLATTLCYTCHSVDYLRVQPPSARAYWQATVVKMQKTFGAPIPDEAVGPIVDYLAKTYGTERSKVEQPAAAKSTGSAK